MTLKRFHLYIFTFLVVFSSFCACAGISILLVLPSSEGLSFWSGVGLVLSLGLTTLGLVRYAIIEWRDYREADPR